MMYIVNLDIRSEGDAVRESVTAAVKTLGHWAGRFPDMFLLEPHQKLSAGQIRDHLKQFLGEQDAVFVARITRNWAGRSMGPGFSDWMGRREFGTFSDKS